MNRKRRIGAWRMWPVLLSLLSLPAFVGIGCSPASLGFLLRDTKTKPEYPLPPKPDQKEINVLIVTSKVPGLSNDPNFASVDRELAGLIGKRLMDDTKDSKHPIHIVEQSKLERQKLTLGTDSRLLNYAAVGKQLGADYVIDVTLNSMSIFQPEYGRELCQGRATLSVIVYDTAQPDKVLQEYVHNAMQNEPKDVSTFPPAHYRRWFTERIACEIAWRHIPHESNERIAMPK